jgi:transposase-like protein
VELVFLYISRRKVKRPSYEKLKNDLKSKGYTATGRKYSVSDNTIRKWLKTYEKSNYFL